MNGLVAGLVMVDKARAKHQLVACEMSVKR
jgi:hypothetical protein